MIQRSAVLLAIAAAACSQGPDGNAPAAGEPIACARGAGGEWAMACRLERTVVDDRDMLVIHRPDGGFRRLVVQDDGAGVTAADGAAQVSQRRVGGLLEISLGDDRYRLPLDTGRAQ